MHVVDSHIHCGVQNVHQPYSQIEPLLKQAGIASSCLFAPVEDIYYRYTRHFDDNAAWRTCRRQAHDYLLDLAERRTEIYPYYFVWNDFLVEELEKPFAGIKWHHHAGEPPYHYSDPRCTAMIDAICSKKLPIVLEETFDHTLKFVARVAGRTPVIVPHLGMLNGGFHRLLEAGVWDDTDVWADTALAGGEEIGIFLEKYGPDRLIFGSDYPFGMPGSQLQRLKNMGINRPDLEKICSANILGIIGGS